MRKLRNEQDALVDAFADPSLDPGSSPGASTKQLNTKVLSNENLAGLTGGVFVVLRVDFVLNSE